MAIEIADLAQRHRDQYGDSYPEVVKHLYAAADAATRSGIPGRYGSTLQERLWSSFRGVEAKDLETVLKHFAEGAVMIDPHYPRPVMRGKEEIARGLRWAFSGMDSFSFRKLSYLQSPDGRRAAFEVATDHRLKVGQRLESTQTFVFDVGQEGLITRMQAYQPYGPHGMGGLVLGVTRLVQAVTGSR
ncbi:nuclear transport factor 2 family protein [Candidatus Daviesbacteria bacterium]|nr:nuclear transport factor 2 family protein [Candidatus Daviesbacteria bacterium]